MTTVAHESASIDDKSSFIPVLPSSKKKQRTMSCYLLAILEKLSRF